MGIGDRRLVFLPKVLFQFSLRRRCYGLLQARMVTKGAGETFLSIKGFLLNHEDLSSMSLEKLGMTKGEAGRFLRLTG